MKSALGLAVLLSVVDCALAALALTRGGRVESPTRPEVTADSSRIEEIDRELKQLREEVERLTSTRPALSDDRRPAEVSAEAPRVPQEVLDRLAALEKSMN